MGVLLTLISCDLATAIGASPMRGKGRGKPGCSAPERFASVLDFDGDRVALIDFDGDRLRAAVRPRPFDLHYSRCRHDIGQAEDCACQQGGGCRHGQFEPVFLAHGRRRGAVSVIAQFAVKAHHCSGAVLLVLSC